MTAIATGGAWIVYGWGDGLYVRAVFADELQARRWKDENYDYDKVRWVEWGEEIK